MKNPPYSSEAQRKKSKKRWGDQLKRFWSNVDKRGPEECWPWLGHEANGGYGELYFDGSQQRAHRVSWQLHKGSIPEGLCVLHRCDYAPCCNPNHLFLGTRKENMDDMARKGRRRNVPAIGEANGSAKLSEADVRLIRRIYSRRECTQIELAKRFKVKQATISSVVLGKSWRHIIEPILARLSRALPNGAKFTAGRS